MSWQGWPLIPVLAKSYAPEMLKQSIIGSHDCMTAATIVHTSREWTGRFKVSSSEAKLISLQLLIWMHME